MSSRCRTIWLIGITLVFAPATAALAQGRGFRTVGEMHNVGYMNSSAGTFQSYSYGLSTIDRGAAATGALQNNISSFGLVRQAGGSGGNTNQTPPEAVTSGSRMLFPPNSVNIPIFDGPGFVQIMNRPKDESQFARSKLPTGMRLVDIFGFSTPVKLDLQQPITSFVPATPGRYAELIQEGEQAMHTGRYDLAVGKFTQAGYVSGKSPDVILSLAHCCYAQGQYALMAHYVRLALTTFPELPLAKIQIRSFFSDSADFVRSREELLARAQETGESEYFLALAYVQWFDDVPDQTAEALRQAARTTDDPLEAEAIRIFWDGGVATGRISGTLIVQTAQTPAKAAPASTTEPSKAVD